jgi:gamma-glutamylcyclotransferase (GGCT)/AIG2-like uncharacterized protein YtfP
MSDLLFVYGTLLSGSGHPNAARLGREVSLIRPARLQGRLFKLSWYPVMITSDDPAELVHGELVTLIDPAASLPWLDAYESIAGRNDDEYERVRHPVVTVDDRMEHRPWVYRYRRTVDGLTRISSGRWL